MKKPSTTFTPEEVAMMFNVPMTRVKEQYRDNAIAMRKMYDKAVLTGNKVNGYTAAQLLAMAEDFENRSK